MIVLRLSPAFMINLGISYDFAQRYLYLGDPSDLELQSQLQPCERDQISGYL
jgi:hypothetical protein